MKGYLALIENIEKKIALTREEKRMVRESFVIRRIRKKTIIAAPDFVTNHRNYVISGALRAFVIDGKGNEHTLQFAIDDWWITDFDSYINQNLGRVLIESLEDTVVAQIDYQTEQILKQAHHRFETLFRIMAERAAAFYIKRMVSALVYNAEERYLDFVGRYPEVSQRLPQYVLASYLDMSTAFLSRIRHRKLKKEK